MQPIASGSLLQKSLPSGVGSHPTCTPCSVPRPSVPTPSHLSATALADSISPRAQTNRTVATLSARSGSRAGQQQQQVQAQSGLPDKKEGPRPANLHSLQPANNCTAPRTSSPSPSRAYSLVAAKSAPNTPTHSPRTLLPTAMPVSKPPSRTASPALPPLAPSPSLASIEVFPPLSAAATPSTKSESKRSSARHSPLSFTSASSSPSMPPLDFPSPVLHSASSSPSVKPLTRTLPLHVFQGTQDVQDLFLPPPAVPHTNNKAQGSSAERQQAVAAADHASAASHPTPIDGDDEFESATLCDRIHLVDHFRPPPPDWGQDEQESQRLLLVSSLASATIQSRQEQQQQQTMQDAAPSSSAALEPTQKKEDSIRPLSNFPLRDRIKLVFDPLPCLLSPSLLCAPFPTSGPGDDLMEEEWVVANEPAMQPSTSPVAVNQAAQADSPEIGAVGPASPEVNERAGEMKRALQTLKAKSCMRQMLNSAQTDQRLEHFLVQPSTSQSESPSLSPPAVLSSSSDEDFVMLDEREEQA